MDIYDKTVVDVFLKNQLKLFPEKVAFDEQEAREFLEDMCAVVCKNEKEAIEYMKDAMDVTQMSKEEILLSEEVFKLPDGRYLIVEG